MRNLFDMGFLLRIVCLVFALSLTSCDDEQFSNEITLGDGKGVIRINIPAELDTDKTSIHISDTKAGHRTSVVFAKKSEIDLFPDKTSWFTPKDSIPSYFLQIAQPLYWGSELYNEATIAEEIQSSIEEFLLANNKNMVVKDRVINENIALVGYEFMQGDSVALSGIKGMTYFENEPIEFSYKEFDHNLGDLYQKVLSALSGMKIESTENI